MALSSEILKAALELSGEEDSLLMQRLCAAADAELQGYLRSGTTPEDCQTVYTLAAAMLAVAARNRIASDGLDSIEAGTLDLHFGKGSELERTAFRIMRPWLKKEAAICGVEA